MVIQEKISEDVSGDERAGDWQVLDTELGN